MFEDGDHFVVVLRQEDGTWVLTDEGHTFMHLSYSPVDLSQGTRARVIEDTLAAYRVLNASGELRLAVPGESFGDALFTFVQALARITATAEWTKERVRSTFFEDFRTLMEQTVPRDRLTFGYTDTQTDPERIYRVDCMINHSLRPCYVFAIANDEQCRDATITICHFERHERDFRSLAVFEDQTEIGRRPLAQLSDVVGRQFSSLGASDRITGYVREEILGENR